jgi:hypothetical protein
MKAFICPIFLLTVPNFVAGPGAGVGLLLASSQVDLMSQAITVESA